MTPRAYLSDRDARIPTVDGYRRDYEAAAMTEASRILAETEPNIYTGVYLSTGYVSVGRLREIAAEYAGYAEDRHTPKAVAMRAALAESLAAFVNAKE